MTNEQIAQCLLGPEDHAYATMDPVSAPVTDTAPEGTRRVQAQLVARPPRTSDFVMPDWYRSFIRATLQNKLAARCAEQGLELIAANDVTEGHASLGPDVGTIAYYHVGYAKPASHDA
ncbi:hypothetical protein [Lentzea cavernae]|nr:hypothetical protein [Lentzea cavernae]